MNRGKWITSQAMHTCKGCDRKIESGVNHLQAQFAIPKDDKVTTAVTIYLCEQCINDFESYSKSPTEIANDSI